MVLLIRHRMRTMKYLNSTLITILLSLCIPIYVCAEVVFEDDFSGYVGWLSESTYDTSVVADPVFWVTTDTTAHEWHSYRQGANANQIGGEVFSVVDDNCHSGSGCLKYNVENTSATWNGGGVASYLGGSDNSTTGYNELYISAWVKFDSSYVIPSTGFQQKLFRVYFGKDADVEGSDISSTTSVDGFKFPATYVDFIGNGYIRPRIYQFPPNPSEDPAWVDIASDDGANIDISSMKTWQRFMYHITLNTAGSYDGSLELYIGDTLVAELQNIMLVDTSSEGDISENLINTIVLPDNYYKAADGLSSDSEFGVYIDDVVVSTTYIGPDYTISGSTTNGLCGSNDGGTFTSLASGDTDNCSVGTVTSFTGTGPWSWDCVADTTDSCSASLSSPPSSTTPLRAGSMTLRAGSTPIITE